MKLGRKRVSNSPICSPKKRRTEEPELERINIIESLPQDILVKVLCMVDQSDLSSLLLVSKTVNKAALVARETHHLYKTPSKSRVDFRGFKNFENEHKNENYQSTPEENYLNTPQRSEEAMDAIAVALFSDDPDYFD